MIGLVEVVYIESSFKSNTIEYMGSYMDSFCNISYLFDSEKSTRRSAEKKLVWLAIVFCFINSGVSFYFYYFVF